MAKPIYGLLDAKMGCVGRCVTGKSTILDFAAPLLQR